MYSEEEVEAAIRRYLSTSVEVLRLHTGARDVLSAKEQVFEQLASIFLLSPRAYFYVIWLASNAATALVREQQNDLQALLALAPSAGRPSRKLGPPTELGNAEAALVGLGATFNGRTGATKGLAPGVARFRKAVDTYVSTELAKNTIVDGAVVETAEGARAKIKVLLGRLRARDEELRTQLQAIATALTEAQRAKLPETVTRRIVSRAQATLQDLQGTLAGPLANQESRGALLELFAMRTLLQRVASLRVPSVLLAPQRGGPATGTLQSPGEPAYVDAQFAGPYTYTPGTSVDFLVDGAPLSAALPGDTCAKVATTATLVFPAPAGMELALRVDSSLAAPVQTVISTAWASLAAAVSAIAGGLTGVEVAAISPTVFQIRSLSGWDTSKLTFLGGSPAREAFLAWAFGGAAPVGHSRPVRVEALLPAFPAGLLVETVQVSAPARRTMARSNAAFEENVLLDLRVAGGTVVANGTAVLSTTINLLAKGVQPGLHVRIGGLGTTHEILDVQGTQMVVSPVVPSGTYSFDAGEPYAYPPGTRAFVSGSALENRGNFDVIGGGVGRLVLGGALRSPDANVAVLITQNVLRVRTVSASPATSLTVLSGAGAASLALPLSADVRAKLRGLIVPGADFLAAEVRIGDSVSLLSPTGLLHTATITAVERARLEFSPAVLYETGSWGYTVKSKEGLAYEALQAAATAGTAPAPFIAAAAAAERLATGAKLTTELEAAFTQYQVQLAALSSACLAYVVERDRVVDAAVRALQEAGYDRALEFFLALRFTELFAMEADGVSYSTWLTRVAATVGRQVTPVTRDAGPSAAWRAVNRQVSTFEPREVTDGE